MKLLLDENLPKRLKTDFPTHEIYTVLDKGLERQKEWRTSSPFGRKLF